jgi:quercetin dioxygenase-like cupin family protein
MFERHGETGYRRLADGIEIKPLVHGERTLMVEFLFAAGHALPRHTHLHEQTGILVKGHIRLTVDGEVHDVLPGDSWCIPGGVEHGGEFLQDSIAVEVFSPVREEYLPHDSQAPS